MTGEKQKTTELDILFPSKEVNLSGGRKVMMHPIPLEHLPKILTAFKAIVGAVSAASDNSEETMALVGFSVVEQFTSILPYCLPPGADKTLTLNDLPMLLQAFVELNLNEEVLGNWAALAQSLQPVFGRVVGQSQGSRKQ